MTYKITTITFIAFMCIHYYIRSNSFIKKLLIFVILQ